MEFVLVYDGELKSNGTKEDKHKLRRAFHPQLRHLWSQEPLHSLKELGYLENSQPQKYKALDHICLVEEVGGMRFAPVVSSKLKLRCRLSITMLRSEPPGKIIAQGGDIDNRLKTLFDAFSIPNQAQDIPKKYLQSKDEDPLFCLLDDDALISGVAVETAQLLRPNVPERYVQLVVTVKVNCSVKLFDNSSLC